MIKGITVNYKLHQTQHKEEKFYMLTIRRNKQSTRLKLLDLLFRYNCT